MKIIYTNHLLLRLKIRNIPYRLPKKIYQQADEKLIDVKTKNKIAIKNIKIKNIEKEIMIAYNESREEVKIITIHPLKKGQKENRIFSGRWIKNE